MSVVKVNKDNINEALNSEKKVLLDFFASWCGPCRMLSPVVDKIAEENPDIFVGKVNVDEEPELAMQFGVSSIPVLVVMKDGKVLKQSLGAIPKQQVEELLAD
ncbi:MAG: thioredoxin [Clostridia bacterium]|nr:thioredoxin [Clostridia bacterium]